MINNTVSDNTDGLIETSCADHQLAHLFNEYCKDVSSTIVVVIVVVVIVVIVVVVVVVVVVCVVVDALMCLLPASIASPELIFNMFIHSFHSLIDSSHSFIHASHSSKLLSCHIMSCHVISSCLIHPTINQSYICMRALGCLVSDVFRHLPHCAKLEESRNL